VSGGGDRKIYISLSEMTAGGTMPVVRQRHSLRDLPAGSARKILICKQTPGWHAMCMADGLL
jgi:hypothetical protein